MYRLQGLGAVRLCLTAGWVICFLAYWCLYYVMFALAAFWALPLNLACSFPQQHSQALMRALAFTLHLPSPLSPALMVSSHAGFCCSCPSTILHTVLGLSSVPYAWSHPSYFLYSFTLLVSLHLLSSYTLLTPLHSFFSSLLFISAFTLCIPLLLCLPSSSFHFVPPP